MKSIAPYIKPVSSHGKIREEVPVPPQTKVLVAGQGNPRWERGFLVASRPGPVVRPLLLRELEPFASRRAVIVPVKSRMCAQYLQTAPDQKRARKRVEEMRRPQPDRKSTRLNSSHLGIS